MRMLELPMKSTLPEAGAWTLSADSKARISGSYHAGGAGLRAGVDGVLEAGVVWQPVPARQSTSAISKRVMGCMEPM